MFDLTLRISLIGLSDGLTGILFWMRLVVRTMLMVPLTLRLLSIQPVCNKPLINAVSGSISIFTPAGRHEIYKQPMFYAIGHFSRFIVENSTRIDVQSSNDCVLTVGYQRPDKSIVIILFNKDSQETNIKLKDGNTKIRLTVPPRSIHTLVYY